MASTLISLFAIIFFHPLGINYIPGGPYGVIFALFVTSPCRETDCRLWQHHRIVPALYRLRVFGVEANNKWFVYILALQLVLSDPPASLIASASGLLTGMWYRSDSSIALPSARSRPRIYIRPLRSYRIPVSLHVLVARVFSPLLGTSTPPRRANRVLPGQVVLPSNTPSASGITTALRNMPSIRRTQVPAAAAATTPAATAVPAGEEEPRSAVGEWVDDLTGRGTRRSPTEEEIAA